MGLFGLSTRKEVERREAEARQTGMQAGRIAGQESVIRSQRSSLTNLGKGSQVKFSVPFFDVFDPRFDDFAVPVSVHGMLIYAIDDVNKFNSINKAQNYSDDVFEEKLKGQLNKFIKSVVANAPADENIPVLKIERKILELSELVQRLVSPKIEQLFGVNVRSLDITEIKVDKDSPGYLELKSVTTDLERENITTQHQVNLSNFTLQNDLNQDTLKRQHEMQLGGQEELQRMQLENQRETMRIQREELQRATRLQTETNFLGAHQANLNAEVGMSRGGMFGNRGAAPQMPQMPGMPPMPGGGMPPMPGSVPQVQYMVGVNGQQVGPCDWNQLVQLVQQGQLTQQSYVWAQGMPQWEMAGNVMELQGLFMQ